MSKSTYLDELSAAYNSERNAKQIKTQSVYKNMPRGRWEEVRNAYNRKVIKKFRRSVGKSNKRGIRRTPKGMVVQLNELNILAQICRNNRLWLKQNAAEMVRANHD